MKKISAMIIACLLLGITGVSADEFNKGSSLSSTDFRVLDPQHAAFGAVSSSSSGSFRLLGAIGDLAIGSSSATTVKLRSGFLYFPLILAPALSTPTAGDTQVSLSWSTGMAQAGLTIGGYNVCTQPPSSSYTCQDVGLVTAFTKTSLTNGSLYTFKIEMRDARGNVIAVSGEKTATPSGVATPAPTPTPAPGGGGGGGCVGSCGNPGATGVLELHGLAYPFATVHVLRNGVEVGTTPANSAGEFSITIQVPAGNATIGFWAQSVPGNKSVMWPFAVTVVAGTTGRITGLIIPPTLVISAESVTPGASVLVHGDSAPGATVLIDVAGGHQASVLADAQGVWSYTLSTVGLAIGPHDIKARTELLPGSDMSTWSQLITLGVGVQVPAQTCGHPPDINGDGRVDLVDFSILAFWWHRPIGPNAVYDLNCDGQVTLADFSILAYYWTGR